MNSSILILITAIVSQLVSSACSGSGFPTAWTTTTPGVTFWFVTETIKRQFSASYTMTDYLVSNGVAYGTAPTCEDEYYDPSSGYYYYLMYFPDVNIYSTGTNRQICHAFKQFDSVIREYYEDLNSPGVLSAATDCVSRFASSTLSFALTKYNFQYTNCPFSNVYYYFTFSNGGNADYCSGQSSSIAIIGNEVISLKSCFDFNSVSKANPFYGAFSCLGTWSPETRDTTTSGDFIVMEMYDTSAWPYCGRYKVAADGTITLSLYLSMSEDAWFPAFCDASKDNEYYFESGTTKYVRMIFTPVDPVTQATDSTTETEATSTESTTTTQETTATESTSSETTTTTESQTTQETTATESTSSETTTTTESQTTEETTTVTSDTVTVTTVTTTTGNSTSTSSSSSIWDDIRNLYWPWWILVAASIVVIATLAFCIAYACLRKRRKQSKVENQKQHEQANTEQSYNTKTENLHYPLNTKDKNIGHVRKIQVQSISPTKVKDFDNKTKKGLDF